MPTLDKDVSPVVPSAGKPIQRIPCPYIALNEIDIETIYSTDKLDAFINLCEQAESFIRLEEIEEAKLANRSSTEKKMASAHRYHSKRQAILTKKKQAQARKLDQIKKKNAEKMNKTAHGKDKKKYHTNGHVNEIILNKDHVTLNQYLNEQKNVCRRITK